MCTRHQPANQAPDGLRIDTTTDINNTAGGYDQRDQAHAFIFTYLPVGIFALMVLSYKLIKRTERKPYDKMKFTFGYRRHKISLDELEKRPEGFTLGRLWWILVK